jgi:hypothetical protein
MMAQKDKAVSGLTGGVAGLFKKNKVRLRRYMFLTGLPQRLHMRRALAASLAPTRFKSLRLTAPSPLSRPRMLSLLLARRSCRFLASQYVKG